MPRQLVVALIVGIAWTATRPCMGADVTFTVSSRETYVGAAVQILVTIKGAQEHETPRFPTIEGADVRELTRADREDATSLRPGSSEPSAITYTWAVTPRAAGELIIPPISVVADGELFSTSQMRIVARESETGDLLYLRLLADRRSYYVGEPIDATLEIWLKLYRNKGIRMDAEHMWRYVIDEDASALGAFAENLQPPTPNIAYRTETQLNHHGSSKEYCVYSLQHRLWAERPGTFDAGGIRVTANYPLRVRQSHVALLGHPFEVVESRPISATVEDSDITVVHLPTENRPRSFRGAIGQYSMSMTAEPTDVRVGDPIVLTLTIRGTGRMDTLHAPRLARQRSLTAHFRVPDEELGGIVGGAAKQFSQRIRPKHYEVSQIPPIEFSYFDPDAEQYITLMSEPIPLSVEESTRPMMSEIVDDNSLSTVRTELTIAESGLLANHHDLESLLRPQSLAFGAGTWLILVFGPVLYAACLLLSRYHAHMAGTASLRRRRTARRKAITALRCASDESDTTNTASCVAAAVRGYVADRFDLPGHAVTSDETIQQLRMNNMPEAIINEFEELLSNCELIEFATRKAKSGDELINRARACVEELEEENL